MIVLNVVVCRQCRFAIKSGWGNPTCAIGGHFIGRQLVDGVGCGFGKKWPWYIRLVDWIRGHWCPKNGDF